LRHHVGGDLRIQKVVRIPRYLLHVELDDLGQLGVSECARDALRALLADLPLVPDAAHNAQLVGPARVTLPCLAVLARHVGQGLRDHNLSLADDRARLSRERRKLVFLEADALDELLAVGDERPDREAALFAVGTTPRVLELLAAREAAGLVSFVTSMKPVAEIAHWRRVDLNE
jgi:hypothetical protein